MTSDLGLFRRHRLLRGHRFGAAAVGAVSAGLCVTLVLAVVTAAPAANSTADDGAQIGESLATMLSAVRTVISKNQDRINNPDIGDKGLDGKVVLSEAGVLYQQATGTAPASIDPNSLHGRLIRMQMDAIEEVMEVHQETINRQDVGFKGFIPAVFSRLVNEAFGRRAAGVAEMKVTAPLALLRNPQVRPDDWELGVIETKLQAPGWPKDQPFMAKAPKNDGMLAERALFPEYYGRSCLTCHGSPRGEIDITGFPKEGAKEGDLGGIISIALYR